MLITRTCKITGRTTTKDLPITEGMMKTWKQGYPIQVVMPHLSIDDREFVMTGMLPDSWDFIFSDAEVR